MQNELVKIRLLSDSLKSLTGKFGGYDFVDGISCHMLRREAERLSVVTPVEFLDNENMWERKARERGLITSQVVEPFETKSENQPSDDEPFSVVKRYARAELEAIADKSGIIGLRAIGDQYGVKGVSIRQLIDLILQAQDHAHPVG